MKKTKVFVRLLFCLIAFLSMPSFFADAAVIDAPHNQTKLIGCADCHSYSLWWASSPSDNLANRAQITNAICLKCHDDELAPFQNTHSSSVLGALHRDELGDWQRICVDCHDPHFQGQLEWALSQPDEVYLVRGDMLAGSLAVSGSGSPASPYISTFRYDEATINALAGWQDVSLWAAKNGEAGRGLILVLTEADPGSTFEIVAVDPDLQEISVAGLIDGQFDSGAAFGIVYGQLIRSEVNNTVVKFFNPKGGFVDSVNLNGICQVCHSLTNHFRRDGGGPDPNHDNIQAAAQSDCIDCHAHLSGFGHGSDGGINCLSCHNQNKHASHLALDIQCSACHDLNDMRDENGDIRLDPLTAPVCANCHNGATSIAAPANQTDFRSGWSDPDYLFGCNSCHDLPPAYANNAPKANSHSAHSFTCDNCHYGSTTDGLTVNPGGAHTNGVVNASPKGGIFFSYTYAAGGGSCENISCHGDTAATWGDPASASCYACHVGQTDVDNYQYGDESKAMLAGSEWEAAGHGRAADTDYAVSGNPGAAMECSYCHASSVVHGDAANPFRLANNTGPDGQNGVCLVCHKNESAGFDPDGGGLLDQKNSSLKANSYHFGAKHGTANNGGLFCWDCHDPHGDSGISMIQNAASRQTDGLLGVPAATVSPAFQNAASGTDYANSDPGPYAGICNVCHLVTDHYTAVSGDGHNDTYRCTSCHRHSGAAANLAFKPVCDYCHGEPPINNTEGGPDGLVNLPGETGSVTAGAHDRHVNSLSIGCKSCHFASAGSGDSHNRDLTVTMGFSSFDDTLQGGGYDGQSGVLYDATSTNPPTTVVNPASGAKSCSNIYCHGNYLGSGQNAAPVWDNAASGACGTCHGAGNNNPPTAYFDLKDGGHVRHTSNQEDWSYGTWPRELPCTLCHNNIVDGEGPNNYTILNAAVHVNGKVDWKFDSNDPRIDSNAVYSIPTGSEPPSDGGVARVYGTCTVYCHSNVQPDGGVGPPTVYDQVQWGDGPGVFDPYCQGCHNQSGSFHGKGINTGSHVAHIGSHFFGLTMTYPWGQEKCTICHKWNAASPRNSCAQQCHDTYEKQYHVNGEVDVLFDGFAKGSYNGTPQPGDGYSTCLNTYCHSDGTSVASQAIAANTTSQWGGAQTSCSSCHANGPDYDNGSPKANSHQVHFAYGCQDCHFKTTSTGTSIAYDNEYHVNAAYDVDPGDNVHFTYTFAADGGSCAVISCHGDDNATWGAPLPLP